MAARTRPLKLNELDATTRQNRINRLAQDPGNRSKYFGPNGKYAKYASLLPEKYKKQRALNARLDAPAVAGGTLTNRQLARERNNAVDMQFGKDAVAKRKADEDKVAGYYQTYVDRIRESEAQMRELAMAQQNAANSVATAVATPQPARPDTLIDPDVLARAAQANAHRSAASAAFLGTVGNANAANAAASTRMAGSELLDQVKSGQKRVQTLAEQIGAFKVDYETKRKAEERSAVSSAADRASALAIAAGKADSAYKLQQLKEQGLNAREAAGNRTAAEIAAAKNSTSITVAKTKGSGKGGGSSKNKKRILPGGTPEMSATEARNWAKAVVNARKNAEALRNSKVDRAKAGQMLYRGGAGITPIQEAQAAVAADLAYYGTISKATLARMHRAGMSFDALKRAVPSAKMASR